MTLLEQFLLSLLPAGVALLEAEIKKLSPGQATTVAAAHSTAASIVAGALKAQTATKAT